MGLFEVGGRFGQVVGQRGMCGRRRIAASRALWTFADGVAEPFGKCRVDMLGCFQLPAQLAPGVSLDVYAVAFGHRYRRLRSGHGGCSCGLRASYNLRPRAVVAR